MNERRYPGRPIVGVGAVVLVDGKVLLVKRRHPPLEGEWSLPGGAVETGETLAAACAREVREETGLLVDVGPLIDVFDRITFDSTGAAEYHFVLVDYLCRAVGGTLGCASDATDVALVAADADALAPYQLNEKALEVIARAGRL